MLSHVIPPPRGYTKVSNGLVRQSRLGSDAKILVIYVQGLPESARDKALGEHARALHITGRQYQKAKSELVASGYVHESGRPSQAGGGGPCRSSPTSR
ncbi:Helix-turn-helix domain-containing protein OS=Streptomyces microflavus OX=1919 GN=Smic_45880 PE=4 SV=1 [Streptomyces microflavus]